MATVYTLLAAATAIGLPLLFPEIGAEIGAILGAVVFVGSAILHEVFARQEMQANLVDELGHLRNRNAELQILLDRVERETEILKGAVKKIAENGGVTKDNSKKNVDSVIAEVKVFQGLVKQLSAAKPDTAAKAVGEVAHAAFPARAMEAALSSLNIALVASEGTVVATLIGDDPSSTSLIQITQSALGQAPGMSGLDDDSILEILRDGLEQNRVDLVLQPIVQLPQRKRVFL
jgi:cyclic-di-GMP phosphodiesterase TipF (flagellum assembly factor)